MDSEPAPPPTISTDQALADCIVAAEREGIRLHQALERLGPASFCFVCFLLSVPFIQPISLGPLTMASGLTFMAAGWQMTRRWKTPHLPAAMRDARIHGKGWVIVLRLCQRILRFCRRFTRPRLSEWITGPFGEQLVGWLILTGGFLLALPFANIPLNNTFPALMILFASIAWLEKDGLMVLVSIAWGIISLLYFAFVAVILWLFGSQIYAWIHSLWH